MFNVHKKISKPKNKPSTNNKLINSKLLIIEFNMQ